MRNRSLALLLLIGFQIAVVLGATHFFFFPYTGEKIQTMGDELNASGMPPKQVQAITSNLSDIRGETSSYVNMVATFLIVVNGSFMYGVIRKFNRDESSQ